MTANHVSDQFNTLFIGTRSRPLSLFSAGHLKREEKPLRHIAMVANFLDDNKSKRHLKRLIIIQEHCKALKVLKSVGNHEEPLKTFNR